LALIPKRSQLWWLLAALFTAAAVATPVQAQEARTTLDFANAQLSDVIRSVATSMGMNVMLTDVPDRRVTFSTPVPLRREDLGAVLESILEAHGLVLVQRGAIAQVLPAEAAPASGAVRFGSDVAGLPAVGLVTQFIALQSIRADEAAAALRQVAGPGARIEAVPRSNALLITDRAANMTAYIELIRRLDERPAGEAGLRTYVVPLKYAGSDDLAAALTQLFGLGASTVPSYSLTDRGLGRALDDFRGREADAFRLRGGQIPLTVSVDTAQGSLIGRTTIVADAPSNSLLVRTAPPNFPLLLETIEALDVRPLQVLLEVTVAEIVLGAGTEFGIDWAVLGGSTEVRLGQPDASQPRAPLPELVATVIALERADVRLLLRALAASSSVRVLSTPEILAVNNREARIVVGSRVPFVASTRLGDFAMDRSVQYEDVGTTLTIIPTINTDGYVSVQILQEVNSLTAQVMPSALNAPVIATRSAATRAIIRDGQTVVIGGLIGDAFDSANSGIPLLKDIPLIGALFSRRSEQRTRTELAIFVTPHIIRSDEDADAIRERIRERMNRDLPGALQEGTGRSR
jgi:general secretion pathway protein D